MNIQGIQSYSTYSSMTLQTTRSSSVNFDQLPQMDSSEIMENDDANSDGVLTIDETPLSEDMFSDADTDGDGALTTEELEAMLSATPPGGGGAMGMMGGMGGPPPGGPPPEMDTQSILDSEDTDGDGVISSEETLLPEDIFSELDTDQDGFLTLEEIEEAAAEKESEQGTGQTAVSIESTLSREMVMQAYQQTINLFSMDYSSENYPQSDLNSFFSTSA